MLYNDLLIFKNIPTLKSQRLVLRKITQKDVFDVFEYASDPLVTKYLLWREHSEIDYTREYLNNLKRKYKRAEFYDWGIEYKGKMIGTVGFTSLDVMNNVGEIGFVLSSKYWGQGIAPEAAREVLKFGFEVLRLNRIEAKRINENLSSKRVLEKLSMKEEGVLSEWIYSKGEYKDVAIHRILKSEYEK